MIRPFSNGFEFESWYEANCNRCQKEEDCDLLTALFWPPISEEMAKRMGYEESNRVVLGWPCSERPR